jgi:alkylated DNA repair protein (DNA oxidative demethylase)
MARRSHSCSNVQRSLLTADLPAGFAYRADFLSAAEERALLEAITTIEFSRVEMRGVVARRRTAHYGWTYRYEGRSGTLGTPIPAFLLTVRARIAAWMGVAPDALAEALLTEYPPGAPIGWHRDAPMFGDVAGISLGSVGRMKFRPYVSPSDLPAVRGPRRTTHEIELAPRSAYLMTGTARKEFEHSIPPVAGTRHSITFRTMADRKVRPTMR